MQDAFVTLLYLEYLTVSEYTIVKYDQMLCLYSTKIAFQMLPELVMDGLAIPWESFLLLC